MTNTDSMMLQQQLPGTGINSDLVGRAIQALLKHHEEESSKAEKQALLGTDRPVQV